MKIASCVAKVEPSSLHARPNLPDAYFAPRNQVERTIADIWQEVLGIAQVGIHDNFFELGGDSLQAVSLFAQIKKIFGKDLSLATLFRAATVEQQASILQQSERSAPWDSLVAIQTGGNKPPLFCVHGADGNVIVFQNLARHLGSTQPVYALQAKGLDGKQAPHTRVEQMASSYIRHIRTVQPEGPYLLAGFSAGGVVAFEMAQQLHAQGQKVAMLVLFDTRSPVYYKPLSFPGWVSRHLGNLLRLEPKEKLNYFVAGTKDRLRKIAISILNTDLYTTSARTLNPVPAATNTNVYAAQQQAIINYVPQVYSGRVILFRSVQQPWWLANDLELGWGRLVAEGLEIHNVPGDHLSIIRANVKVVAEKLRVCTSRSARC